MPDVDTHCAISMERTQEDEFRELHEWIDEPQKYFDINHRLERHTLNEVYRKYVEEHWGERGSYATRHHRRFRYFSKRK